MPTLGKCYSLWKIKWLFLLSLSFLIGKRPLHRSDLARADVAYQNVPAGSMVCALAQRSGVFILGRTLSGSGAAGILQGSMRILAFALPNAQRIYMEGMGAVIMGEHPLVVWVPNHIHGKTD